MLSNKLKYLRKRMQLSQEELANKINTTHEINKLLIEYGINQSGFFDIEKWQAMGPEEIKQLKDYFEYITSRAKEKNRKDENDGRKGS